MRNEYRIDFNTMQGGDLNKALTQFINDQQRFFINTSLMLYHRFKDYPDKSQFDVKDKMLLSYYCLKFLSSVFFRYAKNILMKIQPQGRYFITTDQFGFVMGLARQQQLQDGVKPKVYAPEVPSQQVHELLNEVFGKQYFEVDQKKKVAMRIDHGGRRPVQCTLGMDVSTAVIGLCIFENVHNKPIFLDAVLLTKICDKRGLENNLVNKLRLFKSYFESVLAQKNIKITRLFIEQQCKRFGRSTNAITLNKLRKFNGMVSGYLMQRLQFLQQVSYINVRSRRKNVIGKRMSKQQAYEYFKQMYRIMFEAQYKQVSPKDANMDRSDAFIIRSAGLGIRHPDYQKTRKIKTPKTKPRASK